MLSSERWQRQRSQRALRSTPPKPVPKTKAQPNGLRRNGSMSGMTPWQPGAWHSVQPMSATTSPTSLEGPDAVPSISAALISRSMPILTNCSIPVTDQIAGSLFPTACFLDLICDPFCSGVSCDAKPQNLSSAVPHDQQSIEQAKRDRRHDEQIHRRDAVGMVMKKRLPALRRWFSSLDHIFGNARLSDADPE